MRDLIIEASRSSSGAPAGTNKQRIGDLYASFLDEEAHRPGGAEFLLDELATIDDAADRGALAAVLGALDRSGGGGLVDTDFEGLDPLPGATQPMGIGVSHAHWDVVQAHRHDLTYNLRTLSRAEVSWVMGEHPGPHTGGRRGIGCAPTRLPHRICSWNIEDLED